MSTSRNAIASARLLLSCVPLLALFVVGFAMPLLFVLALGFSSADGGMTIANFVTIAEDPYFVTIFVRTLRLALAVTALAVALGTFEAFMLHRLNVRYRMALLMVVLGPLFVSVVVRTLGWQILLGNGGPLSRSLQWLGLIEGPPDLLYGEFAILVGLLHMVLPYMVLTVWTALQRYDPRTERAARSLGASERTVLWRITLPQVLPGIVSGGLIVFALSSSAFATPTLLGGRTTKVVATAVYDEFLSTFDWPLGAALALVLLVLNLLVTVVIGRTVERRFRGVFG